MWMDMLEFAIDYKNKNQNKNKLVISSILIWS